MPRFCAAVALNDASPDIAQMGGRLAFHAGQYSLGTLPDERPLRTAGPFQAGALIGVGEVTLFNQAELRAELAQTTAPLPDTCTDGDLLLAWFSQHGIAGLPRLRGMFALAIVDGASLFLLRDTVGARPLFYAQVGEHWGASSSLRALRRWPRLPARLNLAAVRSFLTFAYLPGEETLLEGVSELLPGCCLQVTAAGPHGAAVSHLHRYWEPEEGVWDSGDPAEAFAARLRAVLEAAVTTRLPVGEDVGAFLSGGIDSSLVTALAARIHDRRVATYSINFGPKLPNELAYSSLVAAHCGTRHQMLTVSGDQVAALLPETMAHLDCPVGDPLTVPNLLLGRAAAADGLRIILNGEGGDPCFGGPKNLPMLLFELQRDDPDPAARARAYLHSYHKGYNELAQLFTPAALEALQNAPGPQRFVQPYLESPRMRSYLNRLLYTNLRTKGAHHILPKVERLTTACGLEGRSPLFDEEVVRCAFAIPPALKLAGNNEKWILKLAVEDLLPSTIVHRPKSGMQVPVQHWLGGPLRRAARDLLLGREARARDLFRIDTLSSWLSGEGLLWPRHGQLLWLVLTLELWLRAFLDRAELEPDALVRPSTRRLFQPQLPWGIAEVEYASSADTA